MKRILIFSHALELGGVERSLIGLLESLDYSRYQVDLFLMRHSGELMPFIPKQVNLLPEVAAYTVLARPMKETLAEGHLVLTAARAAGKIAAVVYTKLHGQSDSMVPLEYSHKYTKALMPAINPEVEYDLAISFLTPHYFVAEKVNAKRKLAWIHTDYSKVSVNRASELKMWGSFDGIAAISESAAEAFSRVFPELADRVQVIENILSQRMVIAGASAFHPIDMPADGSTRLLSVGRFCTAKNFDSVPAICRRLCQQGLNVKWYLIGFGGDEAMIRQRISEAGMEEHVIILGKKGNPYPYIKDCDLYVQPSRYEGKCVAVREAQMLHKPVIITNYETSSSQLIDGYDGVIVPMDNQGCAEEIARVILDSDLREKLVENTKRNDYSNAKEVEKLYALIGRV